jgi:hypothetical protein
MDLTFPYFLFFAQVPGSPRVFFSSRVFKPRSAKEVRLRHTVGEGKERQGGAAGKVHLFLLLLDRVRVRIDDLFARRTRALSSNVLA